MLNANFFEIFDESALNLEIIFKVKLKFVTLIHCSCFIKVKTLVPTTMLNYIYHTSILNNALPQRTYL